MVRLMTVTAFVIWAIGGIPAFADPIPPGFDAASFGRIGVGGSAIALGGATVAWPTGPGAAYWNPALICTVERTALEALYTDWLGIGISYQYLSFGLPFHWDSQPELAVGCTLINTSVHGIPMWDEEGNYSTFSSNSYLVIFSSGIELSQSPSTLIGINAKVYHDKILTGYSFGMGVDVGLWADLADRGWPLQVGVAMRDIGRTKISWHNTVGEPVNFVPWIVQAGVTATFNEKKFGWAISYEWAFGRPNFERIRAGMEMGLAYLYLRIGLKYLIFRKELEVTFGVGIEGWDWFEIDYAFCPSKLGVSHVVGLKMVF